MKVLVSSCIMGKNCKYNGGNNLNPKVVEFLKDKEVIEICPELLANMPTPRPSAEIVNGIVMDINGNIVDEEYTLVFSKENIKFKTQSIDSEVKWDIYSELWESHDFYYLIQAPRLYTLIPKRVFKDLNEKQLFEEIAQSRVKTTKHV